MVRVTAKEGNKGVRSLASSFAMVGANMLPDAARKTWGEMLAWIAHSVAVVITAIMMERLQAELSISIHVDQTPRRREDDQVFCSRSRFV